MARNFYHRYSAVDFLAQHLTRVKDGSEGFVDRMDIVRAYELKLGALGDVLKRSV